MFRVIITLSVIFFTGTCLSQRAFMHSDTLNKKRLTSVITGTSAFWTGSMIGLSQIWYNDIPKSNFHTFNDSKNWLQMDKLGHFYASYKINELTTNMVRWSGAKNNTALWIGTATSIGYQTTFEIFDGYSKEWGFSWSDIIANTIGSATYLGQQLAWDEERIIPKFSFASSNFSQERPSILGSNFSESLLKDYNGQTYWLSFSPGTFFKDTRFPKWVCFSFGYSAHEKLIGDSDYYLSPTTGKEYFGKREFLLSMDVDFSRLPIKRKWLKVLVKQLNYLKVPFPSIIYRGGKLGGSLTGF